MAGFLKSILAVAVGSVIATSSHAVSYDAVAQFPGTVPFSYGYGAVGAGFMTLPNFQPSGCVTAPGLACYNIQANQFNLPAVGKNTTNGMITFYTNEVQPNQLFIQPGVSDGQAILRFTAQNTGLFPFFAEFKRIDNSDGSGDGTFVGISVNGAAAIASKTLANSRAGASSTYTLTFNQALALTTGDTVDFFVDRMRDTGYDGTGLRVLVPEPASIAMLAMGLLTLGSFARRKRG